MRSTPWLLASTLLAIACSDDPSTQPPPSNKDGSVTGSEDGGGDGGVAGNPDAAPGPMDGMVPTGPCDRVTGGNCVMGQTCYYDSTLDSFGCRIPVNPMGTMPGGNEAMCALGTNDCQAGFHCFSAQGLPNNVCLKGCDADADCAGLMGSGMNGYFCAEFNTPSMPKLCLPRPAGCDPLDQSTCPMGQYCEVSQAGNGCLPEGMVMTGGACRPGQCRRGNVCLNGTCQEVCNAMTQDCSGPVDRCIQYNGIDFGACGVACDVYNPMCGAGQTCVAPYPTNAAVCLPTQGMPSGLNGMCGGQTICQSGLVCVNGACRAPCDMAHPCAMGACMMTNPALAFGGVCI